jgi:general secretion pathway protein D
MKINRRASNNCGRALVLAQVAALVACSSQQRSPESPPAAVAPSRSRIESGASVSSPEGEPPPPALRREEIVERGTQAFVGQIAGQSAQAPAENADINLRFESVDIREFVKVVLGDILGLSYVIDPAVMGTVTVNTSRALTREDVLPLFEQVLDVNDAVLLAQDGLYRVVSRSDARIGSGVDVRPSADAGYATRIISLRFISAQEMQKILAPILSQQSQLTIDVPRNLVLVSGTTGELAAVQDLVDLFDVDWLKGMSVGLYPLDYVDAKTMETDLTAVFNGLSAKPDLGLLGGVLRLVPIDRLNSLLVVSSTIPALREAELWIRRLDQPGESLEQRLYVYPVQNSKATELAELLSSIFQPGEEAPAARAVAPGLTPMQIGPPPVSGPPPVNAPSPAQNEGLSIAAGGKIEIMADDVRNALVVLASARDYRMVESAIRKLDIVPLQVLIEASVIEVTLSDDLAYGVEWFFRTSLENGDGTGTGRGRGALDMGAPGLGALAPGFSFTVIDSADRVRFALNALESRSKVDVLSAPSLMVLDNQTATINVGDEIPIPTRQSISNIDPSAPTVNEVAFRQTGLTLTVTPRVNNSGLVTMDVRQEVATAAPTTTSDIDAPTIQNRMVESVVAVNSGETIVLGGMIQDHTMHGTSGLPFLQRVPVINKLFGTTSNGNARTELMVLITPRVIRSSDEARDVTEEFRRKLQLLTPAPGATAAGES